MFSCMIMTGFECSPQFMYTVKIAVNIVAMALSAMSTL